MIDDIRKSINSILYQRVTSPLFGTFCVSWIVWNWKIVYTTFFIDEDKIDKNKIDYIVENFNDNAILLWYPLLSTVILLTIIPFVSNGAYWLSLKFEKWKIDSKNDIEKKQLLTLEQSIQLREQILESERKFDSLIQSKNEEINQLKLLVEESNKQGEVSTSGNIELDSNEDKIEKEIIEIFNKIIANSELKKAVKTINYYTQGGYSGLASPDQMPQDVLTYFISNGLLESSGKGIYQWTSKGLRLNQLLSDLEFE